jgi:hypothetical protein
MTPNLNPVLSGLLQLTKHFARLFDIRTLPFQAQPSIPSRHFHRQSFLQRLQKLEVIGVQVLERPRVVELKSLGFKHRAGIFQGPNALA